jgi:hypothetical protein
MIRTLAWKEYREQRAVWLIMAVVASAALVGTISLGEAIGPGFHGPSRVTAIAIVAFTVVAMYGVVCASLLLAGERESGTVRFLDALARRRTDLWKTKVLAGTALSAAQGIVVAVLLLSLGFRFGIESLPVWLYGFILAIAIAVIAVEAFAWGMLFSALCRSVLATIGFAALPIAVLWIATFTVAGFTGVGGGWLLWCLLFHAIPAAGALYSSWWTYSHEDTERSESGIGMPPRVTMLWLILRQGKKLIAVLVPVAAVLGVMLARYGPLVWPPFSMFVGVVCGIAAFAPEQAAGWRRFLSDQRFPLGRIWLTKTLVWLVISFCVGAVALITAAALLGFKMQPSRWGGPPFALQTSVLNRIRAVVATIMERQEGVYRYDFLSSLQSLPMWLVYGFSVAAISVLLVRKPVVSFLLSLALAAALSALWLPSLVAGRLGWWQIYGSPLILLGCTRLIVWAWASDRLNQPRILLGLMAAGLLTVAWFAGNFCYRALEFNDPGPPFDVQEYLASIPGEEHNQAGRFVQDLADELPERIKSIRENLGPLVKPPFPQVKLGESPHGLTILQGKNTGSEAYDYAAQAEEVLLDGWPADAGKFGEWLGQVCEGRWVEHARRAAELPTGIVHLPSNGDGWPDFQVSNLYRRAVVLLGARALQLQAAGKDAASLDCIAAALAISRNLCNYATSAQYGAGSGHDLISLRTLRRWALKPGIGPDHLGRALHLLDDHERNWPAASQALKADYTLQMRALENPARFLTPQFEQWLGSTTATLSVLALQTPWEKQRFLRLVNRCYAFQMQGPTGGREALRTRVETLSGESPLSVFLLPAWYRADREHRSESARSRIVLALSLYRGEHHGRPANNLSALVPAYLPEVPIDPFTGRPFPYHVSKGEQIEQMMHTWDQGITVKWEANKVTVPPDVGILEWSDSDGHHATALELLPEAKRP